VLQKALESIREAEEQAAAMVRESHTQATKLRDEMTHTIRTMEVSAETQISQQRRSLMNSAEERGAARAEKLRAEAENRIKMLREEAASKTEHAAARILEMLVS
jgi:vacuolar-type H+-ATPase subunit H